MEFKINGSWTAVAHRHFDELGTCRRTLEASAAETLTTEKRRRPEDRLLLEESIAPKRRRASVNEANLELRASESAD